MSGIAPLNSYLASMPLFGPKNMLPWRQAGDAPLPAKF